MNNLEVLNEVVTIKSNELCDLVNMFREQEGRNKKRHADFIDSIREEIGKLENAGVKVSERNISLAEYIDKQGKTRPCYIMNKYWIMQMLNKESALVRYKTQQYIESLEKALQNKQMIKFSNQLLDKIQEQQKQIEEIKSLIGIRCKTKYNYGQIIKRHLGIKVANSDYEVIKSMFFYEVGISKWEDLDYDRKYVKLLKEICNDYKPSAQIEFNL